MPFLYTLLNILFQNPQRLTWSTNCFVDLDEKNYERKRQAIVPTSWHNCSQHFLLAFKASQGKKSTVEDLVAVTIILYEHNSSSNSTAAGMPVGFGKSVFDACMC